MRTLVAGLSASLADRTSLASARLGLGSRGRAPRRRENQATGGALVRGWKVGARSQVGLPRPLGLSRAGLALFSADRGAPWVRVRIATLPGCSGLLGTRSVLALSIKLCPFGKGW